LQRARHHLVLTQGSEKWEVLQCVLDGAEDPMRWPLQAIIAAGQTTLLHQA
jgi:6-phosphogluconolactonase/glucosamine-6-phosphate isomerase/deaminase